jgi:prevent-host-death family protein
VDTDTMPQMIGVRELRDEATRVVRAVREERAEYVITVHGQPVAVIRPYTSEDAERARLGAVEARLAEQEERAARNSAHWTSPRSAVDLVEAQRRG